MTLPGFLPQDRLSTSFEFFPPKTDEGEAQLWRTIEELQPLAPSFVSVTDGAGGTTRGRTARIVIRIAQETSLTPVAHLTCVGSTEESIRATLDDYAGAGVTTVLALRGDKPKDGGEAGAPGFRHAIDLVRFIRGHQPGFSIGVAGYPDKHPEAPDLASDRDWLATKIEAGAGFVLTQFFFEASTWIGLVEDLERRGITVPVIPGIMPVTNVRQIQRFAELQGSEFPPAFAERLLAVEDDPEAVRAIGVEAATRLCEDLIAAGAPGLHFITLNRSTATREIAANLGLAGSTR